MAHESLKPPLVAGLGSVQTEFKRYQSLAFDDRPPAFFALELAGECGELANLEKKVWRDPEAVHDFAHMADEAADVFIALVNYCNSRSFDLEKAVEQKLVRIEQRRLAGLMGKIRTVVE